MPDLLTPLYNLRVTELPSCSDGQVQFRKALAPEKSLVRSWVASNFSEGWACELEAAMSNLPVSAWLALRGNTPLGFACYDAVSKGFFGPVGVDPDERGKNIGAHLLLLTLNSMREAGYAYAVIGGAGSQDFYKKTIEYFVIPDSEPGIYKGLLKPG